MWVRLSCLGSWVCFVSPSKRPALQSFRRHMRAAFSFSSLFLNSCEGEIEGKEDAISGFRENGELYGRDLRRTCCLYFFFRKRYLRWNSALLVWNSNRWSGWYSGWLDMLVWNRTVTIATSGSTRKISSKNVYITFAHALFIQDGGYILWELKDEMCKGRIWIYGLGICWQKIIVSKRDIWVLEDVYIEIINGSNWKWA